MFLIKQLPVFHLTVLVGYEMAVASSALLTSLAIYHFIVNVCLLKNNVKLPVDIISSQKLNKIGLEVK